jgi:SM-20-related protein
MVLFSSVEDLVNAIERHGWSSNTAYLPVADSLRLQQDCEDGCDQGEFKRAGVGRGNGLEVRDEIRSDQILWLRPENATAGQTVYLDKLEVLRLALNRSLFLGLLDFEGHFAIYPEGAFYKPHLDRHAGTSERIVTVILYLNPDWQPGDGGELKLWTTSGEKTGTFELIEPRLGTLVCFLAGDFWHEVMPAHKTRMSITGWFRAR